MIDLSLSTCVIGGLVGGFFLIGIWCVVASAKRGDEPPAPPRGAAASGGFGGFYLPAYGSPVTPADASTSDENATSDEVRDILTNIVDSIDDENENDED